MPVKLHMETYSKEKIGFLPEKQIGQVRNAFGNNLLVILHAFCGQLLEVHPTKNVNMCCRMLVALVELLLTLASVFCFLTAGYTIFSQRNEFKFAIYVAAGFLGIFECLFRVVYTLVRRRKIEEMFERMQVALNFSIVGKDKQPFARKVSRVITIFSVALIGIFTAALLSNYIATFGSLHNFLKKSSNGTRKINNGTMENQLSMDTLEAWTYVCHFFKLWPSVTLLRIYSAFFYALNLLAIGRIIVSDILFYSWYFIVLEQYKELSKSLRETLREKAPGTKLKQWIEHHHHINELLNELNALTAPVIVLAVVATGLQVCIVSYAILRLLDQINIFFLIVFGLSSLHQVFMYCVIGQKLKDQAKTLHSEAYKGPWLESNLTSQHAALMICSAANEKVSHNLPGAPFFALSMEFYASMLSAVITYFVILIQIK